MIKKVTIAKGQSIELSSSLGWLIIYREQFGHDILPDLMPLIESGLTASIKLLQGGDAGNLLENIDDEILTDAFINLSGLEFTTIIQVIWAMAKKADPGIEGPEDYFDQFERFPLDLVIPAAVKMIVDSMVSSKNAKRLWMILENQRQSLSMNSSSQASTEA